MKIRAAIVGYGNLGKALEETLLASNNFKLVAIFSRRQVLSKFSTQVEETSNLSNFKGKIDIVFLCTGSANDIEEMLPEIAKDFCVINSFDTHSKLEKITNITHEICKANKTVVFSACGWDPGLFSIIRTYFYAFSGVLPSTFWGKGISMGHSDAIRKVDGVIDGVQFTVPNKEAIKCARVGKHCNLPKHFRECYVLAKKQNYQNIERKIKNIENYFKGQPSTVEFVDAVTLSKLKRKLYHGGFVVSRNNLSKKDKLILEMKVKMDSNPKFTAKIMTKFAVAALKFYENKKFGAYLPTDIAPKDLLTNKECNLMLEKLM